MKNCKLLKCFFTMALSTLCLSMISCASEPKSDTSAAESKTVEAKTEKPAEVKEVVQEAPKEEMITVHLPSGLKIVGIDGEEVEIKSKVTVTAGVHEFSMKYNKIDVLNNKVISSDDIYTESFDFLPGHEYKIKVRKIENDPSALQKVLSYVTWTEGKVTLIFTLQLKDETPIINVMKGVPKEFEITQFPKEIEILQAPPTDRAYTIVGNIKSTTGYSMFYFPKEKYEHPIFYARKALQDKDVDAIVYSDLYTDSARRVHILEGLAIKYLE